jgi:hypothetical protein
MQHYGEELTPSSGEPWRLNDFRPLDDEGMVWIRTVYPPLIYEAIGPLIMNRAGQGGPGKF